MRNAGRVLRALLPARAKPVLRATYYPVERALLTVAYRGSGVACPCCGGEFRALRPFNGRPNAQCPACDSLERHRLLALHLRRRPLEPGTRLLHFAPERALEPTLATVPGLKRVTTDPELPHADLRLDIMDLALEDESFDAVVCSHVLEHVADDRRAIGELHRVLRPGGRALIMCPVQEGRNETLEDPRVTSPAERLRVFGQADHLRVYGSDLAQRLASAGFETTYIAVDSFEPDDRDRYSLGKRDFWGDDQIYDCRKR